MSHIHTLPGQHDHTISIYIIRTDREQPKIVFHFHRKFSKYLQFGGHTELDETTWQAVIRELKEETGYGLDQVRLLQPRERLKHIEGAIVHPQPVVYNTVKIDQIKHGHIDSAYAFVTAEEPRFAVAEGESNDFKEFSKDELVKVREGVTDSIAQGVALYILDRILGTWEEVDPNLFG